MIRFFIFSILLNLPLQIFTLQTDIYSGQTKETENTIIWQDNFNSLNLDVWEVYDEVVDEKSNWYVDKGYLVQDTDSGDKSDLLGTNIISGNPEWDNYIIRTNVICADDDYIGVLFRYKNENNYYRFLLSSERKEIRVDKKVEGNFYNLSTFAEEEWQYVKFSITIFLKNENIKVYLNDRNFFEINDNQFSKGKIGLTSISNLGSFFDDITIYSDYKIEPQEIKYEITRGPYLQNITCDKAVIMWNTSLSSNSIVEYGLSKEAKWSVASSDPVTKHEIKLENLNPETDYYYRVKSDLLISDWFSLKTAAKENSPFSFIAYGDNQMNFLRHREIVEQISKHDFDFIIHCGDVVQRGPREDWDVEFFDPLKNILTSKPIYVAIGNHEQNSKNYYENFSNPNAEHENYYSLKYGNSFFVFVDNPRAGYPQKTHYTDYTIGSDQYKWLKAELSSDEAQNSEWLFVVSHVPSYVAGSQEHFIGNKKNLVPLFEKYGVDISFSGHIHGYERGYANGVKYIITAGGGGAQNKKSAEQLKKVKSFKVVYNFCRIDIHDNLLLFKAYDINNQIIDEFELRH